MDKIEKFLNYKLHEPNDIPKIPLYIDQVTSYLEDSFSELKLNEDDKILTKTMINNYVKAQVISSPVKKKYNKEQMMKLKMLYLLKNTMSLSQINSLLQENNDLESLYHYFIKCDEEGRTALKEGQQKEITEEAILKLLLSSQLQKKYAELLLEQLMDSKESESKDKKKEKKKKESEKNKDLVEEVVT